MLNFLLLIFILAIPFDNKTAAWFNFGGGLNFDTVFIIILLFGWLLNKKNSGHPLRNNPLNIPIILFIFLTFLSNFTGFFKAGAPLINSDIHAYKRFITTFLLFFVVANTISEKKYLRLLWIMGFTVILISMVLLKEHSSLVMWHYSDKARIELLGMNANYLGAFFVQFFPLFAASFFIYKGFIKKSFFFICFFIGVATIMFTYSRGSYLAFLGALLALALFGGKKSFFGFILLICAGILATSIFLGKGRIIPVSVSERFQSIKVEDADKSIESRKKVWEIAKSYIKESPVFGYGFGSSRQLLPIDTHNSYFNIALECGIPALLVFIWLILRAFIMSIRTYKRSRDNLEKSISLGFVGIIVAFAIGNYFGTKIDSFATNGYFAVLMGMVANSYTGLTKQQKAIKTN